jgi:hypothetical protein
MSILKSSPVARNLQLWSQEGAMAKVNPIQMQKFLGGVDYPTDKQTLVDRARENGADDDVLETLEQLSASKFNSPNDVSEAIGKLS